MVQRKVCTTRSLVWAYKQNQSNRLNIFCTSIRFCLPVMSTHTHTWWMYHNDSKLSIAHSIEWKATYPAEHHGDIHIRRRGKAFHIVSPSTKMSILYVYCCTRVHCQFPFFSPSRISYTMYIHNMKYFGFSNANSIEAK